MAFTPNDNYITMTEYLFLLHINIFLSILFQTTVCAIKVYISYKMCSRLCP